MRLRICTYLNDHIRQHVAKLYIYTHRINLKEIFTSFHLNVEEIRVTFI